MKFETLPLSLIQQDIYFDQMNHGQNPLYNVGGYIHLPSIDIDRITSAHQKLVMNHDVFGLRIVFDGSEVTQYISHERNLDLPVVDLSHHDEPQQAASQWLKEHFQSIIPIDEHELYKATLLKLSNDLWFYVGLAHHIVMDGWGFANWAERLGSYYMNGTEPATKPWSAVIENEQNYLSSTRYLKDKDYWVTELDACPKPFLTPYYKINNKNQLTFKSERFIADIPQQRHQAVSLRAKELDVPVAQLYQIMLANYFATVYALDEIVISTPVHNRRDKLDKSMLGTFISVVPLRIKFDQTQSQQALCEQVSKRIRSNFRHQRFPLGEIMREFAADMFQLKYSYLSVDSHLDFDGKPAHLVYQSHDHEQTPLMFTLWEYSNSHIQLHVDHNLAYFNHADMAELVDEFFKFVDAFLATAIDAFSRVRQNQSQANLYNSGRTELIQYWQDYLKGIPQAHNLPLDRSRHSIQNYQAGVHTKQLDKDTSQALSAYCDALGIPVTLAVHCIFSVLTARMSASEHALIALQLSNSDHSRHVLLHTHITDELQFEQLLAAHKKTLYDVQFASLPEAHLLHLLAIPDTQSHKNIYQLSVSDNETPPIISAQNQPDIILQVTNNHLSTCLHWHYDTSLFDLSTIEHIHALLIHLMTATLDNPEKEVKSYTLLSESSQTTMLSAWNNTHVDWPQSQNSLHTLFEQQAKLTPTAVAIQCKHSVLSYQALNERSDALARYLVEKGVEPEQSVGICLSRTADMMVAVLAVLKSGGAYVPLDPSFPEARLSYMVTHSGAQLILTEQEYQNLLFADLDEQVICLNNEQVQTQIGSVNQDIALPHADNRRLAYIIYTSGSTGKPKGVMVEHAAVNNLINSMASALSVSLQDKLLAVTTLSFDISVLELFLPLLNGACVYIASQQEAKDPQCLIDILANQAITVMQATPATWQMMLTAGWQQKTPLKMLCGGEALPDTLAQSLLAQSDTLWNVYGPTETTIWSTFKQVELHFAKPNVIGKPIANTQVYVLDTSLQPVPVGVPGELYIGGQGLARGYWAQDDLTAQRFVSNSLADGALMYRTGDLVRWLPDGQLQFIARIDNQIKLRGYRLELGEIEYCLNELPSIIEGVVACINNGQADAHLVAYYTAKESYNEPGESLKAQLASQLPSYMVPELFIELDAMPLTANGKIDRKALPQPNTEHSIQQAYVAPRNEIEAQLCDIWQMVLNVERVSVTDSFFALGGHSLTATKAISTIRNSLDLNVSVKSIFENPSVAAFAAALNGQICELERPELVAVNRDEQLPLSYSQQRLWFVDQINNGSAQYNMPGAFQLEGHLNTHIFEQTVSEIIKRHEVLRTCFVKSDGKARQVITQHFTTPISYTDLTDKSDQESLLRAVLQDEADRAFNLSDDLMLRVHLVKLADTRHVALFVLHHIASDGWSVDILSREFGEIYNAFSEAKAPELPLLSVQYADYAIWQQTWLQGDYLESQLDYWQSKLAGIPEVHSLPLDLERSSDEQLHCGVSVQRISDTLYTKMTQFCDSHNITLFMLLETTLAVLIHRYSREHDVVIGSAIAGRDQSELEPLIGFFVNDMIIRTQLNEHDTFIELLERNRNTILDAYAHQHVPFEMLVERLAPNRDLRYNPLVQIKLDLHTHQVQNLALNGIQSEILPVIEPFSRYDLYLSATQSSEELSLEWLFNKSIFKADSIERMSNNFEAMLEMLILQPSNSINAVPAITAQEQIQLTRHWNDHQVNYALPDSVHHVFEQQVQRTPAAIAIISSEGTLSYEQLNAEANQVAHFLNAQGIGNGAPVGLCVERSMEMLIGLLGILKAGCCYVPLEPRNPGERIAHMLKDSGAQTVLTDSELMAELPFDDVLALPLDEQMRELLMGAQPTSNPTQSSANALAYIMYTSGSTGLPKGVMVPHRGVVNYLQYAATSYLDDDTSAGIVSGPLVFDATLTTLLSPLSAGKTIQLLPDDENVISHLAKQLSRTDSKLLFKITPAHLDVLAAMGVLNSSHDVAHTVVIGGEQLTTKTLSPWLQSFPNIRFINEYGPTETVVGCCVYSLSGELPDTLKGGAIPIGTPIANTQLYVLNDALQVQAIGAVGELYIAGHGVAHGYHNKADLTASSFIKSPAHLHADSDYIYRSGDLVKWQDDGQLLYIGRIDEQVKLRGFRIELTEIEHKLGRCEGVGECVVLCREDGDEKRLVAYLTLNEQFDSEDDDAFIEFKRAQVNALRAQLKTQLPSYMIPSVFVFLGHFPLTTNGKLDKKVLPAPSESDLQKTDYIAPRNDIEKTLCEIWEQVLGLEEVGIEDNFFALGGDSIVAIQISSRASQNGLSMAVRQMFEYQTIAEISQHVEHANSNRSHAEQADLRGEMSLMPIQQQFFDWQFAEPHHFNQSAMLFAPDTFDELALKSLLIALLTRHDALRLRFTPISSARHQADFVQLDEKMLEQSAFVHDLSGLDHPAYLEQLRTLCRKHQSELHYEDGPIIKAVLFTSNDKNIGNRIFFTCHHLVVDGVSWRILHQDLALFWQQWNSKAGIATNIVLGAKTSSYRQFVDALIEYAQTEQIQAQRQYWLQQACSAVPALPIHHQGSCASARITLSTEQTQALLGACNRPYRTKVNEIMLAALSLAWQQWSGESRMRVMLEGHGREEINAQIDVSSTIGWFTTLFPLVLEIAADSDITAAIIQCKTLYRSIPDKGIGFGALCYLSVDTDFADAVANVAQDAIVFNYLGQFDNVGHANNAFSIAAEFDEMAAEDNIANANHNTAPLTFNGMVSRGELQFTIAGSEQFSHEQVNDLAQLFRQALVSCVRHCQHAQSQLTFEDFPNATLSGAELAKLGKVYPTIDNLYITTPTQSGMLFHGLLDGTGSTYTSQTFCDLVGDIDAKMFKAAWQQVVDRHDILRTCFTALDGVQMHQVVTKHTQIPFIELDWCHKAPQALAQELAHYRAQDKAQSFDFEAPPLTRITLIKLSDERYHFVWSHHHTLLDGWCLPVVFTEVLASYEALLKGKPIQLAQPIPYERYIEWLNQQNLDEAKHFWQTMLGDVQHATPINIDTLAVTTSATGAQKHQIIFDEASTAQLQALAKRNLCTMSVILQAAWACLLRRYSDQNDVVFGLTVSGRPAQLKGVEHIIGLFINTLPTRVQFDESMSLAALLKVLQRNNMDLDEYGYLGLAQIQQLSGVDNGQPLFDSVLVYENYPNEIALDDLQQQLGFGIEHLDDSAQTNYGLTLVARQQNTLRIDIGYYAEQFDATLIERLAEHFQQILNNFIQISQFESNDPIVQQIDMLNASEQNNLKVLGRGNDGAVSTQSLVDLFTQQAALTPNNIAVSCTEQMLTYKELAEKSTLLAHYLLSHNVKKSDFVAVQLERGTELMVVLLGILKCGAVYIPLDSQLPEGRIQDILQDSQPAITITYAARLEQLSRIQEASSCATKCITIEQLKFEQQVTQGLLPTLNPRDDLAYILYTSGSTGKPKGVMVSHHNLANYLQHSAEQFMAEHLEGAIVSGSIGFDATVCPLFTPLLTGKTVCMLPEQVSVLETLPTVLLGDKAYLIKVTPSHLRALENMLKDKLPPEPVRTEHVFVVGGETLTTQHLLPWQTSILPVASYYNQYGPTETTVAATVCECVQTAVTPGQSLSIGRAIHNTQLYVCNSDGMLQPIGVPGELYIAGHGVAQGYLSDPDKTGQHFLSNPHDSNSNLMYRTGDTVRWLPCGQLEFLGRKDDQLQLRGYRIELADIERAMASLPMVKQQAVRCHGEGELRTLIGYVVPTNETFNLEQLQDALRSLLPEYMLPSRYVVLDDMPLNQSGKIDRQALARCSAQASALAHSQPPQTNTERTLSTLWQSALGMEQSEISRTDNFFNLGGHSLMATRLISLIRQSLHIELPLKVLFEQPTLADQAAAIDNQVRMNKLVELEKHISDESEKLMEGEI